MFRFRLKIPVVAGLLALSLALAASMPAAATPGTCYTDWSEAAPIVAREQLRSARDIQEAARRDQIGSVMRITLCQDRTEFTYHVLVRDPRGRISLLRVDARLPLANTSFRAEEPVRR